MALTWTIKQSDELEAARLAKYGESAGSMIYSTTMLMMAVGIGELTEGKAGEFFGRVKIYEKLYGAARVDGTGYLYCSEEDVRLHVGLSTNATPYSRKTFMRNHIETLIESSFTLYQRNTTLERA